MEKIKRQKFKPGSLVNIKLSGSRLSFGRLLPGIASMICVYDFVATEKTNIIDIDEIVSRPILFYCGLFRAIITKGIFEIIGFKDFTEKELANIPPLFTQDMVRIDKCTIFWIGGGERKATPQECIGLERSSVWNEEGIIHRIEDHHSGKKNFQVELSSVMLSKDDPRHCEQPHTLRWDFEKQEFYRSDMT